MKSWFQTKGYKIVTWNHHLPVITETVICTVTIKTVMCIAIAETLICISTTETVMFTMHCRTYHLHNCNRDSNSSIITIKIVQCSKFASAVSKWQGFCWGISMFCSICLSKKMLRQVNFLEILKNISPKITNLISWCRSFTVLSTDVCILFSFHTFLFSYISF